MKKMGLNIISHKEFDKEVCEKYVVFALVAKKVIKNYSNKPPKEVRKVLKEFLYVFYFELPDVLPSPCVTFNTL